MATRTGPGAIPGVPATERPAFAWSWLIPGLVAAMVMGMWQMIVEAVLPGGAGFWSPLVYIAAMVMRGLQGVGALAGFNLVAVIVGLMGHMMNSLIFGLIYAWLVSPRVHSIAGQLVAGMVYGAVIFAGMWFIVVPLVDPVMLHLNTGVFFVGHLMWGGALGLLSNWIVGHHHA